MKKFTALLFILAPWAPLLAQEKAGPPSMISQVVNNAGFAGWTTIAMSIFGFFLVFKLIIDTKRAKLIPDALVDDVETAFQDEDYEGAFAMVQHDPSFMGKVLEGGMSKMNFGHDAIQKGAEEAWANEQTQLLQVAGYVQLCGQLAPMLGLFGTVSGMMAAFAVLATSAGAAEPKELATGIMNALVTTFIGLLVAIPCNLAYTIIRNKVINAGLEVAALSATILDNLRESAEEEE
ncbi:MAG: MotA/TolQ/ExbB proton channel family protein [Planctomycetes bacterium]|nr:MotA/TolQ/ExbB proton channel family protein [Planctomycetota bacterium]